MRAVIAIRVSPRPAENVRYSPELQESQCREWCLANDHEVVGTVSDILVSGGSRHRFDSVLDAIERWSPDLFVVADLSRWTRDTPTRYYAMRAILEDSGIRLVSVLETFVGSDMPFSDTITTAVVEANYQQRLINNRKTSAGVRKAWTEGKRPGHCFGWTWTDAGWIQDRDLILALYNDWIGGVSTIEMARRYGLAQRAVSKAINAQRQVDVVGAETWELAQRVRRGTSARRDARRGNVWRGLLVCPFCGKTLQQSSGTWGCYLCVDWYRDDHTWTQVSARRVVAPVVRAIIDRAEIPDLRPAPAVVRKPMDLQRKRDRLVVAWSEGKLSDERYEREMADLVEPPPEVPLSVVRDVIMKMSDLSVDCTRDRWHPETCERCPREPAVGTAVNDVLRAFLDRIEITPDRQAVVHVRPEYQGYIRA